MTKEVHMEEQNYFEHRCVHGRGEGCRREKRECDHSSEGCHSDEHCLHNHESSHCKGIGKTKGCGWGGKRHGAGRKCEGKRIPFNRRLSEDVIQKIKDYAVKNNLSETEVLEIAIKNL